MTSTVTPYLLTALPPVSRRTEPPVLSVAEFRAMIPAGALATLVDAVLTADDLRLWPGLVADASDQPPPVVLEPAVMRGESSADQALGEWPRAEGDERLLGYWEWVRTQAQDHASQSLAEWVAWEVLVAGTVRAWRAQTHGSDGTWPPALSALASSDAGDQALASELAGALRQAEDPLAVQTLIDDIRWRWLDDHDHRFTFRDDEVVLYAARLALAWRWHRILHDADAAPAATSGEPLGASS